MAVVVSNMLSLCPRKDPVLERPWVLILDLQHCRFWNISHSLPKSLWTITTDDVIVTIIRLIKIIIIAEH